MHLATPTVLAISLSLFASLSRAQDGQPSDPLKQFKQEVAFHLGVLKDLLGEIDADLEDQLDELVVSAVTGAISYDAFLESLVNITILSQDLLFEAADSEARLIESFTSGAVGGSNTPPEALMPGACAEIEKFQKKLAGMLEKADAGTLKDVKKALGVIDKALDRATHLVIAPTPLPDPPAPGPGVAPQPATPKKPVRILSMAGGSDIAVADDGRLCVGGTADPTLNGGNVIATIVGPNATLSTTVAVDPLTCRWRACFTDLREGNYAVSAHQGGATTTARIGVPGLPRGG